MNASKTSNMLPEGWLVITKYRKRGSSKGKRDRTYYSPDMRRFRSLKAVKKFLIASAFTAAEDFIAANEENEDDVVIVVDSSSEDDEDDENDPNSLYL